jgi:hypothetical protein
LNASGSGKAFRVHDPKNATDAILDTVQVHIQNFEKYLKNIQIGEDNKVDDWIDVDECIKHFLVQEFSKNPDANFYTSIYFSWVKGEKNKNGTCVGF